MSALFSHYAVGGRKPRDKYLASMNLLLHFLPLLSPFMPLNASRALVADARSVEVGSVFQLIFNGI